MSRQKMAALVVGTALLVVACSDDTSSTTSSTATAAPETTSPGVTEPLSTSTTEVTETTAAMYPNGLHGVRYCEVLLVNKVGTDLVADVWNTMGHSECPQADWDSLDAAAIATERGAMLALLNGPRFWTLDAISATMQLTGAVTTFGTIEMVELATVNLGSGVPDQSPYHARAVTRDTVFRFHAGTQIYLLTDADGVQYVMQSYSQIVDPTMSMERLATLGDSLHLPTGWTYTTETLAAQLDVYDTDNIAMVLQDDFKNSYQRIDTPAA